MEKLIITAAVVGGVTTRRQNPNLPYTASEIAKAAIDSWKEGASIVHIHARDPLTGRATQKPERFAEIIRIIRNESDVVINTSTGGGPGICLEDRIGIVPVLSADPATKPEIASLNCGSLNFGLLNHKKREFILNDVQMNPWASVLHFADTMKQCGIKPELEVYDSAMVNNAMVLHSIDAIDQPLHFQFILGVLGGIQPTVDNLVFLKNLLPPNATWSVCSLGLTIYNVGAVALATGGHVRVGLEDCVYMAPGVPAESSAQLVAKMVRLAGEMGREVATSAEARKILSLP